MKLHVWKEKALVDGIHFMVYQIVFVYVLTKRWKTSEAQWLIVLFLQQYMIVNVNL